MCGIVAVIGKGSLREDALNSLKTIVHRGSSAFEISELEGAVLGANRLPIVDRVGGQQPLFNEDKSIAAVQNGEIFNYRNLQEDLKSKGHIFSTDSDTEVLVHLFEEYGPTFVSRLDSEMFAFVIYNQRKHTVYAARDPLGVKPLYYAKNKLGNLFFGSELKQLANIPGVEEVHIFPAGHYYWQGKFTRYYTLKIGNTITDENKAIQLLERQLVDAVRKRVQTDLPIGVFMSGGVDSSLIMEIATRLHPDVTAIILGYPGSSDYEYAVKICTERGYKYHVVSPEVDYEKELDGIIYSLETYEPLIIRQSFSLDICSKEARKLGLQVVLVGEGSDELFAGYNEFSAVPESSINRGCKLLTESLQAGHLLRVDRMSMRHTVELRSPFFDREVVATALQIAGSLKVRRQDHQLTTKYILRKVAEKFLPSYIAWRYKVPFSNGAGMNVGNNFKSQDGEVAQVALSRKIPELDIKTKEKYSISTNEGEYYLHKYIEFGFSKLVDGEKRIVVKDTLNDFAKTTRQRLVVAEFDRLALYFPAYLASTDNLFRLHNLDVDFVATGGDDQTYASLVNNSAQIGLSDPMFAMFENKEGVKGEIIGELITKIPSVAIAVNPRIYISTLNDFQRYRVGTFQEFTTTNSMAKYFLPANTSIQSFHYKTLIERLINREIDIAILLPEQAVEIERLGGKRVYDFANVSQNFLFSGFTIANTLENKYQPAIRSFISAVRESVRSITKNQKKALKSFTKMFPEISNPDEVLEAYMKVWSKTLQVQKSDYAISQTVWNKNYPQLLRRYTPYFKEFSVADLVIQEMSDREFRRDFPFLEDRLHASIMKSVTDKLPLQIVGFWGAGKKKAIDQYDLDTLSYFQKYIERVQKTITEKISVTFILSDAHAKSNGYSEIDSRAYLNQIARRLKSSGFQVLWLSELWKKWGLRLRDVANAIKDKRKYWWRDIAIAQDLEAQAQKQYQGRDKTYGAQQYYTMRLLEKRFLEKEFSGSIFFTYTDSQMQSLLPTLPTLYLYTRKRGVSEVPWFTSYAK